MRLLPLRATARPLEDDPNPSLPWSIAIVSFNPVKTAASVGIAPTGSGAAAVVSLRLDSSMAFTISAARLLSGSAVRRHTRPSHFCEDMRKVLGAYPRVCVFSCSTSIHTPF